MVATRPKAWSAIYIFILYILYTAGVVAFPSVTKLGVILDFRETAGRTPAL